METITVYSNQDLRTLERGLDLGSLDNPQDELTGSFEYLLNREQFAAAYKDWNHDEHPLLKVRDQLGNVDIFLGRPSARRIQDALQKGEASVQLF